MAVILIVEDDGFLREDAETMIQDLGHDILSASDVDEALLLLRSPRRIDALFTDIYLKRAVLGGYEIADQAIKLRLNLPVLYTTGTTIDDKMKTMFVDGAHFLQKPYTRFQLQSSVEVLLAPVALKSCVIDQLSGANMHCRETYLDPCRRRDEDTHRRFREHWRRHAETG